MSESIVLGNFRVQVDEVFLVHARFLDTESTGEARTPVPVNTPVSLTLAFHRHALNRLTIALAVEAEFSKPYRIEVIYAGTFRLTDEVPPDEIEESWKRCAAQVAPIVLYPFVREIMANLSSRGRSEPLVLPILAFQGLDPETIKIPKAAPPQRRRGRRVEPREKP